MGKASLYQLQFARTLAEDIARYNRMYLEARPVLLDHHDVPKAMAEAEWYEVVHALKSCYNSVKFLHKVAMLAQEKMISNDVLYILYYDDLGGYVTEKLTFLVRWCGTGLDLAADYTPSKLARMATTLIGLVKKLDAIHRKHGADLELEGYGGFLQDFEEKNRGFFPDPGRFDVCSDNYVGNYVEITDC
jgi:hypothetical protein